MNNIKKFTGTILCAITLIMPLTAGAQDFKAMEPIYEVPEPCAKFLDEIEKYPWDSAMVAKIAFKESKCDPKRHNYGDSHKNCKGSWNLMQVGCLHYSKGESRDDVPLNIEKAYEVYKDAGDSFRPWTTCKLVKGCR